MNREEAWIKSDINDKTTVAETIENETPNDSDPCADVCPVPMRYRRIVQCGSCRIGGRRIREWLLVDTDAAEEALQKSEESAFPNEESCKNCGRKESCERQCNYFRCSEYEHE